MRRSVLKRRVRARRDSRGAAAVEFALILVPFVALVFGMVNFGDILSTRQAVSQAATEGARAGAVSQKTVAADQEADARKAVDSALQTQGLLKKNASGTFYSCGDTVAVSVKGAECTVKVAASYTPPGQTLQTCASGSSCVWVTVVVNHDALVPGFTFGFGGNLRYTASARVS